ncbi:Wadjet anti-phage system protein JetD domain-containing protein [Oceanisphaera ostreae]|uniref:Wadjet anti-phage system protein JetD domain-containing protein n=1 Tax=Oceanisphaera ostreae TaxID=914151 RepID=A0ABW3KEI4_9GAMM
MLDVKAIRNKLTKQWQRLGWHHAWLKETLSFPYQTKLPRLSDKQLLHDFALYQRQLLQLRNDLAKVKEVTLIEQEFQFSTMGRQRLPVAIEFANMEALARFLGQLQAWRHFVADCTLISDSFPELRPWLPQAAATIGKYVGCWPQLLAVCRYLVNQPRPGLYIRQLDISGVDSKFIEAHKPILKTLLDQLLPATAIDEYFNGLREHGFEKRYGLNYEQPTVSFRLLDPALAAELGGLNELSIPLSTFSKLDLLLDRVFITENKVNGLAFPAVRNALVIYGLGYGVQMLQKVPWLASCRLHYWGDIDSHGFAMLSQLRSYFPQAQSLLMDSDTLLHCRPLWGTETKPHAAVQLPRLNEPEQVLYQQLKQHHWQPNLRLEQERVPFSLLQAALASLP